jgi:uncharacterized repeat protein (TIGR01451 family)
MARTIRFALAALMISVSLLLPVLLRGQVPSQSWGPATDTPANPPVVIASTGPARQAEPGNSATNVPRQAPVIDDALRPPLPAPLYKGQVATGVDAAGPLRLVSHEVRTPAAEASPLSPGVSGGMRIVRIEPPPVPPMQEGASVVATPGPLVLPAPMPQATGALQSISTSVLSVEVQGPAQVILDDLMPAELLVRNLGNQVLTGVRVELPLPAGIRYVAGDPRPEVLPDRVVWTVGILEVRGERRLRTDLMVKNTEDLALQPVATYSTGAPYRPQVIRPIFAVQQLGPEVIPRGMTATLRIQLTNNGSRPLGKVVLGDLLPPGLYHAQGTYVRADVGTLNPGEARTVNLEVLAHRSGRWLNEVAAEAEGGVKSVSRSAIVVAEPSLAVRLLGPERVNVAGEADFRIEVANARQGPAAQNIRLTQTLPEGLELLQATGSGQVDPTNRRVVWQLGTLEPGKTQTVFVKTRCLGAGIWNTQATLTADQLAPTTAECSVAGEGGVQLGLTVHAREESLEVNGENVYEARLSNLGALPGRNVRLSVWVPDGLGPVRADGPASAEARIQQQQVVFDPWPTLEAKGTLVYRLRVKGQRPGTWRLRVEAMADQLAKPLVDELPVDVRPDSRIQGLGIR